MLVPLPPFPNQVEPGTLLVMLPFRLAAIDLDDTLLGPDKAVGPENANALRRLTNAGVHCVLASGRRHENMIRFHRRLGLEGFLVSCNGALVRHGETGETLLQTIVPAPLAHQILVEGDRRGATQNFYHTDGGLYVREKTIWTDVYQERTGSEVTPLGDLAHLEGDALKILWIDSPPQISVWLAEMREHWGEQLYITTTDPEYLEFMAPGVSKAVGVQTVAAKMNLPREQILAFGDGNNDVPLLKWAGFGVAVSHARPAAQAAADFIAPPGDPETAFARAVEAVFNRYMPAENGVPQ